MTETVKPCNVIGRYRVEYYLTYPKKAIGIAYFEGSKYIRTVMTVYEPSHEKNIECETACIALNELYCRISG